MKRAFFVVVLAGLTAALPGCMSSATLGRARTLPAGHWEVWLAPEAYVVAADDGAVVRPTGQAGVRYGLIEGLELDADVGALSGSVSTRIQLVRSMRVGRGIDLAVQPGVNWSGADKLALFASVLLGANLGEHQLVVAPRVAYQMRLGGGGQDGPVSFAYVGGSVGVALRLDRTVTLFPEVSAITEIHADPGFATNLREAVGLTAAVGLLFEVP